MGVDLNGTDASVDIPHGPTMDPMENAWSVAAWAFISKWWRRLAHCLEG